MNDTFASVDAEGRVWVDDRVIPSIGTTVEFRPGQMPIALVRVPVVDFDSGNGVHLGYIAEEDESGATLIEGRASTESGALRELADKLEALGR